MNRIDQQLGNYRLLSQIGRGGFAEVYLGEHIYLKTKAAIKVLRTHLAEEEHEKFFSEAQTIAHLQHNHIVRVLEFGVEDDTPYLVMEYAPNGTLRQRFPRGKAVPLNTILPVVKQIAAALQYAHGQNLIHRDVKPENMLIGENDEILLSDFGISLIIQETSSQERQEVVGTISYMAPEQLQGNPHLASDQYALGVIVYEWLAGERPFQGSFVEISSQHMFTHPASLREKAPSISLAVEAVVMKALAKDPEQRFASVQEFANALEAAALAPTLQQAFQVPTSSPPRSRRIAPARLRVLVAVFALLVLAGGGLAYYMLALHPAVRPAPLSSEQLLYLQATRGMPAIDDPLRTDSSLAWNLPPRGCTFTGGALHVYNFNNTGGGGCNATFLHISNFALQIQVTIIKGDWAALDFRDGFNPPYPGYFFYIASDGTYSLFRADIHNTLTQTFSDQALINFRHSPAIKTGANQTNLLTIIARGSAIYLYINKQFVAHTVDSASTSGFIGVVGVTTSRDTHAPVDVAFRNLQIWNL